ncbi:MAG: NAD(P)-dependent alcohol dehydrogenase [Deltaproteobacteria bacterium]|nr:NAD(P)-dependent alcohol dehydrogenase [Deltaproteobacteria bacterium]
MAQRSWKQGEPLVPTEFPTPVPRANELVVDVKAIGVNPVDWKMRTMGPLRLAARLIGPSGPFVPGIDFAGIITAKGEGVKTLQVGDAVVGGTDFSKGQRGSYADTVCVRPEQVCLLPPGFDLVVAGALPVAAVTAWMSLVELGKLHAGQKALILGASGGVGQFCVQLAKNTREAFVVGVCSTKNVDLVKGLGADVVVDYSKGDALAQAKEHGPYQVVVDCAGGYSGSACRALLGPGGRHVIVAGDTPLAMLQAFIPPFRSKMILARATTERLQHVVDAVAKGQLKVNVAERFPLAEAEAAHKLSEGGRMTGKIVLIP